MKKALTIIAISLIIVLTAGIITLAVVKTDYNQISLTNIESIEIAHAGAKGAVTDTENSEIFNKIIKLFKESTKETVLSSLFQQAYTKDARASIGTETNNYSDASKTIIKIDYREEKTITLNGKNYVNENMVSSDKTVKYDSIWFEVKETETLESIVVHFRNTKKLNGDANTSSTVSHFSIKFLAQTQELYNYLVQLKADSKLK